MEQLSMLEGVGVGGDTRLIECACGCGTQFEQQKVGRVRMYLNDTHKSRAYRARAKYAEKRGDELMAFVAWVGGVSDELAQGAKWDVASDDATEFLMMFAGRRGAKHFNGFYDAIALFRGQG